MFEIRYMPGSEEYTPGQLNMLYKLIHLAAIGDPGEGEESQLVSEPK